MNRSVSAWTIGDCVEQLKTCDFECEAGRLENNVGYKRLLEIASEAEHWRQSYWDREAAIDAVNAELAAAQERERAVAVAEAADRERVYQYGHRDARHVAAEIAAEADARIAALEAQLERAREALRQYANRENWGYLDESGCFKGAGSYTDHCVLGPEAAEAAIAGEASGEERR